MKELFNTKVINFNIGDKVTVLNGFRDKLPKDVQKRYDIILFNKFHEITGQMKMIQPKNGDKYVYLVNGVYVPGKFLEIA